MSKIFGIGLNKTGTSTLGECGRILGYRCTSFSRDLLDDVISRRDFSRVKQVVAQFDLFEDWPYPLIYRELDQMFPGSKFILTLRKDEYTWLHSLKKHALRTPPFKHCRKLAYGYHYPHQHEQAHLDFYRRHQQQVRAYFKQRPDDLLEVCWENGDGWEKLCAFLGKPVPDQPFPHVNQGSQQKIRWQRYWVNRVLSWTRL